MIINEKVLTKVENSEIPENGIFIIPEEVIEIGASAFCACVSLESIYIPKSVCKIGKRAFCDCTSLKSVELPEGITEIDEGTFDGCSLLEEVIIPKGVTKIKHNAFHSCKALKKINLPNGLEQIENEVFNYCASLEKIVIPDTAKKIGEGTFSYCRNLKCIVVNGEEYNADCASYCTLLSEGSVYIRETKVSFGFSLYGLIQKRITGNSPYECYWYSKYAGEEYGMKTSTTYVYESLSKLKANL